MVNFQRGGLMRGVKRPVLVATISCFVLLHPIGGFAQEPIWSVETTMEEISARQMVTARSRMRPAKDSPYIYELTLSCSDTRVLVMTLCTFQANASTSAIVPRPIMSARFAEYADEDPPVLRHVLEVRFMIDGKSPQTALFETQGSNRAVWRSPRDIRGMRHSVAAAFYREFSALPSERLVLADVFPGEAVEFTFAALTDDQRRALRTTCFPAEAAPPAPVERPKSVPTNAAERLQPAEPGVVLPRPLRQVEPQYTADAMNARIEGVVLVEAVVLPDGTIGEVKVTKSLDNGLDEEAVKAVRQWRFTPGLRAGKAVPVLITIEMSFTLRGRPK
jgi:TonB family protein